jgi:23S rRNA pseudouridine2605 synthase
MGGRVAVGQGAVAPAGNHDAVAHDDATDRHFALVSSGARLAERQIHETRHHAVTLVIDSNVCYQPAHAYQRITPDCAAAMTQKTGTPARGKRDRGPHDASPSRRPKPGFSGFGARKDLDADKPGARKFGAKKAGAEKAGAEKAGAKRAGAKRAGAKRAGARKFDGRKTGETGGSRPRSHSQGKPGSPPGRHANAAPREGGESRRSRFPDVVVPARGRDDENRIAKVMARAGLCSRREAEDWIAAGRVAVNGGTISSPAINVTERDRITVDGEPLPRRERTRLFLYHKPAGLVTTNADPEGRPTVFDALPEGLPRLMSIGRLDIGTEGLLLLTNDGGLARELELPETGWVRRYRVRAHGHVSQDELDKLRDGVTVDGIHYGPVEATLERDQGGANVWISFAIREGKNREVRNVLAHVGLAVNRLIRVEFGPFGLGALPEGEIEEVETTNLRAQLGPGIVARAGCDFSGPAAQPPARTREQRRERRYALRERLDETRRGPRDQGRDRDHDDRRPSRTSRGEWEEQREKPPGRPRRGHAWRQEDAPLHRTYRGSRREDLKFADEERPDKRTGVTTDRKGRSVVVERFGEPKERLEPGRTPARAPRRGPPRDRASGPRPSRPRFAEERADGAGFDRPRRFGHRTEGHRDRPEGRHDDRPQHKPGRGPRPHGWRDAGPRPSGGSRPPRPRSAGERTDEARVERPRKSDSRAEGRRDAKPGQKRSPRGERPGPRPSGKRPPRKR